MIRIKFEVEDEEEVEVTPLPFESENEKIKKLLSLKFFGNNVVGSTSDNNNVTKKSTSVMNEMAAKEIKKKKNSKLDQNFSTNVPIVLTSIKTEPAQYESSSLSLTSHLNHSLNIQSLLRQHRIQNRWTNENSVQSIQQAKELTVPNGTQKSLLSTTTIKPNYQEIFSSLNQNFSILQQRLQQSRQQFTTDTIQIDSTRNENDQDSVSNSISSFDLSLSSSSATESTEPSPPEAVPLLVGKKPLQIPRIPPLLTLEEKKARIKERNRLWYNRQKVLYPEVMAEKIRQKSEYNRKRRQQGLVTPEQREQKRLKRTEKSRRLREMETEEQRHQRLEQKWNSVTPEEWEKRKTYSREYYYRSKNRKKENLEEQSGE